MRQVCPSVPRQSVRHPESRQPFNRNPLALTDVTKESDLKERGNMNARRGKTNKECGKTNISRGRCHQYSHTKDSTAPQSKRTQGTAKAEGTRRMRSAATNTFNNVNRTVNNAGTAAGVAAEEMPRFNNNLNAGVNVVNNQAGEMNRNLNAGVNSMNHQAGVMNETAANGVNVFDQQANAMNETAASGVNILDQQASAMNETAANGVDMIDQQASAMNETAANGIDMLDQHAADINMTAESAVGEMTKAVESFESTSEVIKGAIEMWAPSFEVFLNILGPLQYIMAAHYLVLILKMLGVLESRDVQAKIWKEVRVTNAILQQMADGYREVETPGIVQKITKSSIVYHESTNTIKTYFFYSKNNMVIQQLRGLKYFAYDTISELLEKVYIWNAFGEAASQTAKKSKKGSSLSKFDKRRTEIYFLDPCPNPEMLSPIEFTKIHRNVTIVNHCQAKQHLIFSSVKVHEGCFVQFEHCTVCKIDATRGGKAHLRKCEVGWNLGSPSPIPFLFGGSPDKFNNPYNVCGAVSCRECTTCDPSTRVKNADAIVLKRPSKQFASCGGEWPAMVWGSFSSSSNTDEAGSTVTRTITNVSDTMWYVKFEPCRGVVSDVSSSVQIDLVEDEPGIFNIPPFGGTVTFRVTHDSGYLKPVKGTLVFMDSNRDVYCHKYRGWSNLTDFTITCPAIAGGKGVMDTAMDPVAKSIEAENLQEEKRKNAISHDEAEDTDGDSGNEEEKKDTILVVGRFGSGKSTFLNTLAGVHWTVTTDESGHCDFVINSEAVEQFETSRSARGCTRAAVASDIVTFDGRELTVIDTVGYEDTVNADSFYSTSNLTEVMDQYKEISAVVIVVNSQDPRLTRGFVESLACVPTSFKTKVQKNIVLVFTKWTEDDQDEYGEKPDCGFTEQIDIIKSVLGVDDNDEVEAYWMDNRPFKKYEKARRTIDNLSKFLNHIAEMPRLSCPEFKEMRALSQFERAVRKEITQYFQPSNRHVENPSGFEKLLFACARRHAKDKSKVSWISCTPKTWSDKLIVLVQRDIIDELPKDIQRICNEVAVKLNPNSIPITSEPTRNDVAGYFVDSVILSGYCAIISSAVITFGISLAALPAWALVSYAYSTTWSREDVINEIVFTISKKQGEVLCSEVTGKFISHVDKKADELQKFFESL